MKVYVYAICKNEEKNIKRWYDSMNEADSIYVLDTGSEDNSIDILRSLGVHAKQQKITPFRFDTARNISLDAVPHDADICVCTDIDEVLSEGWREKVEKAFESGYNHLSYRYEWSDKGHIFTKNNIHSRHGFKWVYPVHEELSAINNKETLCDITLYHYPDSTKSRSSYLDLLELSVAEKNNYRHIFYLGREYFFHKRYDDCINSMISYLADSHALWCDERCAAMRYIAKSYSAKNDRQNALLWFMKSCTEAPHIREPFCDTALYLQSINCHDGAVFFAKLALDIQNQSMTYLSNPEYRGGLCYDIIAVSLYYTGRKEEALLYERQAHTLSPENKRIAQNLHLMTDEL